MSSWLAQVRTAIGNSSGKLETVPFSDFSRSGHRSRVRFRVLAVFAVAGVLLLCFLPYQVKQLLHTRGRLHSVGHFVVFLMAGYILNRTSRTPQTRVLLFLLTLLLAFGTEFGEHLAFGTDLEWKDVAADALGSVVGSVAARFSSRRGLSAESTARMRR